MKTLYYKLYTYIFAMKLLGMGAETFSPLGRKKRRDVGKSVRVKIGSRSLSLKSTKRIKRERELQNVYRALGELLDPIFSVKSLKSCW